MQRFSLRGRLAGLLVLALGIIASSAGAVRAELLVGLTTGNQLVRFDSASAGSIIGSSTISGVAAGESILGIDYRPATGQLYGLGSRSDIYVINALTGVATQVGNSQFSTLLSGGSFGFNFNPTVDRIRVTSNTGQDLRLNPNDGTVAAVDGTLAYATGDPNAGTPPRIVGSAYTNGFAGATTTTLYNIDSNLDVLTIQNPPNNGTQITVGMLGFNTSDNVGFDISGVTGNAFAALTAPGGNTSQLFSINLATGAATNTGFIGGAGSGIIFRGLTFVPSAVPEPASLALLGLGVAGIAGYTRRRKV